MKNLFLLFFSAAFYLFAISCDTSSEQKLPQIEEKNVEEYRHTLPAYEWLENGANYRTEIYKDSALYHFNHQIENKNYEDAANYLIAYGNALDRNIHFDSIYFKTSSDFYNTHKKDISGEAQSYLCYYLGAQSYFNHQLDPSFKWFKQGIELKPESKSHKQIIGFTNFSLAQNYSLVRDFENTEKHLIAALRIFEDIGDVTNQGTVYLLLHDIFVKTSALDEAEKNLKKGLQIVKQQGNKSLTFSAYSLYVNFNIAKADTIGAIKYIDSMAIHAKQYPGINNYHKALLNQLLAFKHIAQREDKEALDFLKIAREMTDQSNSLDLQMRTLFQEIMYAEIFDKTLKNPEEAERFYNEIAAEEEPNTQFMTQLGSGLYTYYTKKKDFEKANIYATFLLNNRDKESKELIQGKLFELERKFKTEQKENKILLQEKQLKSQREWLFAMTIGAVFLILIFIIFMIWHKSKSLAREKVLAENFTSLLLSKTEEERKRIASDLHDSVSNELVNLRQALETNSSKFSVKIDNILEEVRNISRNLSPTLFDKLGLKLSIEQLTDRAQNQHSFLLTSDIDYSGDLSDTVELQLYRIIQEATTNMMKHANAMAGKITITEDDKYVYAEIKDNGKGFDADKMLEKGNCFGLLNITERTKFINGTVNIKSNKNGTTIKLTIPK
ncbi:ATP-binding protein [Aequorivita sinensis]|uniref:ATP-binding protein n=1 Tax=Aequorivita sinensis TaxID=1382458 RepID=UPI00111E216A|nr:sensor histidine kinase [Aequorivita sinensis]